MALLLPFFCNFFRFFFYEETEESKVEKKIGNVTSDTEITFEYGVRTNKKDTDVKSECFIKRLG